MILFPAFLKLERRRCLVVGAGAIAQEKIEGLLRAGADVYVVAPQATPAIRALAAAKKLRWDARRFRATDLIGTFLVVAATSSAKLHNQIYKLARKRGVLCNVVDDPPNCDFYYGSVMRRGSLQIAISTSGHSPALAQRIRKQLEKDFGPEYEHWIEHLGKAREDLFTRSMDAEERKRLLHQLASKPAFESFKRKKIAKNSKNRPNLRDSHPQND